MKSEYYQALTKEEREFIAEALRNQFPRWWTNRSGLGQARYTTVTLAFAPIHIVLDELRRFEMYIPSQDAKEAARIVDKLVKMIPGDK